ncbi:MAG: tetratricopeptide repeat protein, partial [Candidatus Competibacterales bacterium]
MGPWSRVGFAAVVTLVAGCQATVPPATDDADLLELASRFSGVDDLTVVDCLLSGKVINLGGRHYTTRPRLVHTVATLCEIRGGVYTTFDPARYQDAYRRWLPQAKGGDATAQTYVGELHERGLLAGSPDYDQAAQWYQRAADQGNPRAQVRLATFYERGLGVEQDIVAALNLYRSSSALDDDTLTWVRSLEDLREAQQRLAAENQLLIRDRSRIEARVAALEGELVAARRAQLATQRPLEQQIQAVQSSAAAPPPPPPP